MNHHTSNLIPRILRYRGILIVTLAWIAGILSGCAFAVVGGNTYYLLLQDAYFKPVTLYSLCVSSILPLCVLLISIRFHCGFIVCTVVLVKTAMFSACAVGIHFLYRQADWLVRYFVQFSDIMTLPLLCWLSLDTAKPKSNIAKATVILWYIFVCLTDHCVISPFFMGLIGK